MDFWIEDVLRLPISMNNKRKMVATERISNTPYKRTEVGEDEYVLFYMERTQHDCIEIILIIFLFSYIRAS